jgi:hypothetical protein
MLDLRRALDEPVPARNFKPEIFGERFQGDEFYPLEGSFARL